MGVLRAPWELRRAQHARKQDKTCLDSNIVDKSLNYFFTMLDLNLNYVYNIPRNNVTLYNLEYSIA